MIDNEMLARLLHLDSEEEIANAMLYAKGAEKLITNTGCKADYDDPLFVNLIVTLTTRWLNDPALQFSDAENATVIILIAQLRAKQQAGGQ